MTDLPYERPLKTNEDVKEELENLFSSIKGSKSEDDVVKIQKWVRSILIQRKLRKLAKIYRESDLTKRARLRQLKVREIIDTEQSYLVSLDNIVTRYYEPMAEITNSRSRFFSSPILSKSDHSLIFMNIVLITEFHKNFFVALCTEYNKWPSSPVKIGRKFIELSPFLKLYTEYTNCYQQSADTLQKCLKRNSFAEWMEEHRKENMDCVPLESLLIMPVQRIPRYRMLLEEVVKYTPEGHIDYKDLCKALEIIKEIATCINERKRENENSNKVAKIQSKIRGLDMNICQPSRRLLKRGELFRFNKTSNSEDKRFFYLFNDMMMATVKLENDDLSIYDGYILIRGASIVETKNKNEFGVKYDGGKVVYYRAPNEQKKIKWVSYFEKGIGELTKLPLEKSPDFLLEKEHFGGGTSKKSGTMKTFEKRVFSKLRTRYFTIRNGVLYKKKSKNDKDIIYSLQLENYKLRSNSAERPNDFAFELVHPKVTYTFVVNNENEKAAWISAFQDCNNNINQPITDLCVIQLDKGDKVPLGYIPIQQSYYNHSGDTNGDNGGRKILICYEKGGLDDNGNPKKPITDISIAFTDSGSMLKRKSPEIIPVNKGWYKIEKTFYDRDEANLNRGKGGRDIYLVYKREQNKPAITRLSLFWNVNDEGCPPSFVPVDYTVTGAFIADLNSGSGGPEIYLCYQKESNEDKFFQSELGWDPTHGFNKEKMSLAWQDILHVVGISDEMIKQSPDTVRFIAEEIVKKYQDILSRKEPKNTVSCYCCKRLFEYPEDTNKVLCPFCQTINQCIYVPPKNQKPMETPSAYTVVPKKQLASSCGVTTYSNNPQQTYANNQTQSFAGNTYMPSYATVSNTPQNLPSYITGIPNATQQLPGYLPQNTTIAYYNPQVPQMEIPLGTVLQKIEKEESSSSIDFSILSDLQYKELLNYSKKRLSLKHDGLEDFQFVEN